MASQFSSYALNREINNDIEKAYYYHEQAFDIWKNAQEPLLMMLTLKHLAVLGDQIDISEENLMVKFVLDLQRDVSEPD